jgi:hypothetical protein
VSPAEARAALAVAECRRDWETVKAHLARARGVDPSQGPAQAALIALSLDHAYQAFEAILLRLERASGLPERTGASWHASLLADAAVAVPGLRPPVFPPEAQADWDGLLRFRHFLRHAYVVDLGPSDLAVNLARLDRAVAATEAWLASVLSELAKG